MELSSNDNDDMPTACSPSLPNESKTTHKAVRKEESFSTKVVPLNKCLFKRKLERNRHQTELRLDQLGDKDILISKIFLLFQFCNILNKKLSILSSMNIWQIS